MTTQSVPPPDDISRKLTTSPVRAAMSRSLALHHWCPTTRPWALLPHRHADPARADRRRTVTTSEMFPSDGEIELMFRGQPYLAAAGSTVNMPQARHTRSERLQQAGAHMHVHSGGQEELFRRSASRRRVLRRRKPQSGQRAERIERAKALSAKSGPNCWHERLVSLRGHTTSQGTKPTLPAREARSGWRVLA